MQDECIVVFGDFRDSVDHNPVLRAMMMALQRQGSTCVHGNTLHLEPVAVMNCLVKSPRAIHARVSRRFISFLGLQFVDDGFDILGAVQR